MIKLKEIYILEMIVMAKQNTTRRLTELAILCAIIVLMSFTPLGYLKIGPLAITFLTVPVAIGAIALGAQGGLILGTVFGITSFAQCFGLDAFGTALFGVNPLFTAIMCILPRAAMGYLSGLCFDILKKTQIKRTLVYAISAFSASILNTILFVSALILLFRNTDIVRENLGDSVIKIIGVLVTTNSLVELVVCTILVTIIAKAVIEAIEKR